MRDYFSSVLNSLASTQTICTLSTATSGAFVVELKLDKFVLNFASERMKVHTYKHMLHFSTNIAWTAHTKLSAYPFAVSVGVQLPFER